MDELNNFCIFKLSIIFHYVGILASLWIAYKVYCALRTLYQYVGECQTNYKNIAGEGYALITGGAGGIGKCFAAEFAARGINLYLIDIKRDCLIETEKELTRAYPNISIITKIYDLTKLTNRDEFEKFQKELDGMEINILFNNAGIFNFNNGDFCNNTHDDITRIISINSTAATLMCLAVLPQMLRRKNGLVLSMSSVSSLQSMSLFATYGATKAFVKQLSKCLGDRYPVDRYGVGFHVFYPSFIETPLTEGRITISNTLLIPTAADWVKSALKSVGNGTGQSAGSMTQEIQIGGVNAIPPLLNYLTTSLKDNGVLMMERRKQD